MSPLNHIYPYPGSYITTQRSKMRIINLLNLSVQVLTPMGSLVITRPATLAPIECDAVHVPLDDEGLMTEMDSLGPVCVQVRCDNLPDEVDGTVFIVPQKLARAIPERTDLFYPENHPYAAGHVLLVHAASTHVLGGHQIMQAEHPDVVAVDAPDMEEHPTPEPPARRPEAAIMPGNRLAH